MRLCGDLILCFPIRSGRVAQEINILPAKDQDLFQIVLKPVDLRGECNIVLALPGSAHDIDSTVKLVNVGGVLIRHTFDLRCSCLEDLRFNQDISHTLTSFAYYFHHKWQKSYEIKKRFLKLLRNLVVFMNTHDELVDAMLPFH